VISLLPLQDPTDFAALTLLSLVQGLTEFLPISSSGHLVLAQAAMGFEEPVLALDVALHVGTLLAVVVVYRKALFGLLTGLPRGEVREVALLLLATLPAAVVGLTLRDRIGALFHSPNLASLGLFATAGILLAGEWARRRRGGAPETPLGWKQALLIGCAQALAICPGISRSGATIATAMLCGRAPADAARFSFLLSIPAILGAAVLSLPDAIEDGLAGGLGPVIWAAGFAGFVGWGALRVLLTFLGRGAFSWFAAYCIGLGTGALMFS
jgi:undecaprenyl-diphosphatase